MSKIIIFSVALASLKLFSAEKLVEDGGNVEYVEFETRFQCDTSLFCRKNYKPYLERNNNRFKLLREYAKDIRELQENGIIGIKNDSHLFPLISAQNSLCLDDTIGFLLDENVENYKIACVWTGMSQYGSCVAVPEKYTTKPFFYIHGSEWAGRVNKVREALKCEGLPATSPRNLNHELFICNDRCIQGGIGFLASIIILVLITLSFFKNCG
ncbi:unnamed protein product [Caenorhabditis angaria]|uniref:Uncharacterized protein n=1 Tax=Caenorhabditis angaria TaxID=860376 RepID=A0A9P1MUL7_9PELO|nr:unnamed protein product [Caenorhabditis angaria]